VGRFGVGLSPVSFRHAGVDEPVQFPAQGRPDKGGAPSRMGGGGPLQFPGQGVVELHYDLLHNTMSIYYKYIYRL